MKVVDKGVVWLLPRFTSQLNDEADMAEMRRHETKHVLTLMVTDPATQCALKTLDDRIVAQIVANSQEWNNGRQLSEEEARRVYIPLVHHDADGNVCITVECLRKGNDTSFLRRDRHGCYVRDFVGFRELFPNDLIEAQVDLRCLQFDGSRIRPMLTLRDMMVVTTRRLWDRVRVLMWKRAIVVYWLFQTEHLMDVGGTARERDRLEFEND